jgi:RNA polymerase II subunit A small phosphatase-like protein
VVFAKTLVLDLDETLIHASTELPRPADFHVGPYGVLRRPGVEAFLAFALAHFEHVGVWTASTTSYAIPVLDQLVDRERLSFIWGRQRCTLRTHHETRDTEMIKDIRKLTRRRRFRKEQILFVDDTPAKLARSYGNLIAIRPFEGDPADRELLLLERYLRHIGDVPNVRVIEKRGWRERVRDQTDT